MQSAKKNIISKLQEQILHWQGFKAPEAGVVEAVGLGEIEAAFPKGVFPTGAIHEFICATPEDTAASHGFLAGILSALMKNDGACLWVSTVRQLFPSALHAFNVTPDKVLFVDPVTERDALWVMEEGLKCGAFAAVVTEVSEVSLTASRRLQLAVEKSGATGFVMRTDLRKITANACAARWQVTAIPSEVLDGMPGLGYPRWRIELLKVKNGNGGVWDIEWSADHFTMVTVPKEETHAEERRKVG